MHRFWTVSEKAPEWGKPGLRFQVLQRGDWGVNGGDVFHDRWHVTGKSLSQLHCFYSHWF